MYAIHRLALLAWAFTVLAHSIFTRFVESGTSYYVGARKGLDNQYKKETLFIQFNAMRANDSNCELRQTVKPSPEFNIRSFTALNRSQFKFTPLLALNVSSSTVEPKVKNQIKVYPANDTGRVLDYKIYKKNSTCYTELALIGSYNISGTFSTVFVKDVCLNTAEFIDSPVYNFSLPNSLQYFQTQEMDEFYDLTYTNLVELTKVEFRVGSMIRDQDSSKPDLNQQSYRKILLTEIRDSSWKADTNYLNTRLRNFVMLPLSTYNVDYKQFLVFERNTSVVYLISNYNGVQKTSNSSMQMYSLPFNTTRISYANAEFLLFEEPLNLTDVSGNIVQSYSNYYLKLPLGKKLEISDFKDLKFLTRGRYLSTFTTLQRTVQLYDFETPDLDGTPNETPITTLYFSKAQQNFAPYIEEKTSHLANTSYEAGSYHRVTMESHLVEIYKYKGQQQNMMLLTNRITGLQVPEINLYRDGQVHAVRYLSSHNLILIKFLEDLTQSLPSIMLLSVQNPYVIFTVIPEFTTPPVLAADYLRNGLPSTRSLQVKLASVKNATSNFSLMCPSDANPTEFISIFNFSIVMVTEALDYFVNIETEIRANKNNLKSFFDVDSVFQLQDMVLGGMDATFPKSTFVRGSFFLNSFGGLPLTNFSLNQNLRKETYKVSPSTLDINSFILYQAVRGRRLQTTLVIDLDSSTEYFELFGNDFKFKRNALDNREITNVDIIDNGDVMLNVSRNIFVLNFENLQEKPLTGVGSFCRSIILGKIYNIPEALMCLSDGNLFVHYTSERYSTKQARINLIQIPDADMLDKLNPVNLIYSPHFPGWLIFLSDRAMKGNAKIEYSFNIVDIYSFMSVHLIKHVRIDGLTELDAEMVIPGTKILFVDCIENTIVIVTSRLNFFLYLVKDTWAAGPTLDHIVFLRMISLNAYFQSHKYYFVNQSLAMDVSYNLNITRFETIKLLKEPNSDTSYQGERDFDNRLAFLLEITAKSGEATRALHLGVILNHLKSAYEAFQVIVRGDPCDKLHMGPAFIVQAEIQQKSLAFICVPDLKAKPPVSLNVSVLQSIDDEITFSKFSGAADIFDYSKSSEVVDHAQTFNVVFAKPYHVLDIYLAQKKGVADFEQFFSPQLALNKKVAMNFSEPYRIFRIKPYLEPNLKEYRIQPQTSSMADIFKKHSTTYIQHRIQDYFEGHIFQTKVLCESMVECREKVINGTVELIFTGSLADYPDYGSYSRYRISAIKLPKSYNPDYQITYVLTKDFYKYSYQNKVYDTQLNNLGENCTDFVQYEGYLIGLCEYNQSTKNFFRVFDMNQDVSYFEIHFQLDSRRGLMTKELIIAIKEDYLILYTFNGVFNRYLSVFVFRLVQNLNYTSGKYTRFFSNKLKPDLAIVFLFTNPMNDEFVEFKSYLEGPPNQQVERIFFWSIRRNDKKSIILRAEGWEVQQVINSTSNTKTFNTIKYCDDQRLQFEFKLSTATTSNYLLDYTKALPLESENPDYYDVILNLPYAQDYLIRVNRSMLNFANHTRTLNVKTDVLVLSISNPFFGIKMRAYLRPVFWNGMYISTSNFIPDLSIMRMYYLGPQEKASAQRLESGFLFNYADTDLTDKRNSLEEKELKTIYTFGVVNYPQYLLSVSLLDPQFKLGDYNYTQQVGKKERDLYLLFVNGTFNILRISNYVNIGISRSYLASNKLTLQSLGPKTNISLDVTLRDNEIGVTEILVFILHTLFAATMAGTVVWALYQWQKRRPEHPEEDEDDLHKDAETARLNEESNNSGDSPAEGGRKSGDSPADRNTELPVLNPKLAESSSLQVAAAQGVDHDGSVSPAESDDDEEVDSEEYERQQEAKRLKEEANSTIRMPQSKVVDSDGED